MKEKEIETTKEKSQKCFKGEEIIMEEKIGFVPVEGNNEMEGAGIENGGVGSENNSTFKVCGCGSSSNLPAKTSVWSKIKGILTYEIKVELTPYQQKIEDEINEFLHQEITWKKFKDFLFQEITFGKKNKA